MNLELNNKAPCFNIKNWGLIDYEKSNEQQQLLVRQVYEEQSVGHLIFCTHNPLVTTGRATKETDIHSWNGHILKTPRGGRATYHGPNQLVIYPVINLNYQGFSEFKSRDVTSYLRLLEKSVVETLKFFNISSRQRCEKIQHNNESLEATGVWVGNKKIASIGIAVRRWVAYHGIAINVFNDSQAFQGINPCGFSADIMTSIESEIGQKIEVEFLKNKFIQVFNSYFK